MRSAAMFILSYFVLFLIAMYDAKVLLLFFPIYFLLATWTYGVFVPSGLFVPCILTGAAWGRLFAVCLSKFLPNQFVADSGLYAVIGAAAFLGKKNKG